MSSKWTRIGNNALENQNIENMVTDFKERERLRRQRRMKAFKWGMKIDRMKIEKPKKNFNKEEESE